MTLPFSLGFERPELLWLFGLVPVVLLFAWRSRRRFTRPRWLVALGLRTVLLLAIISALTELTLRRKVDDLAVIFVVDSSASVGASGREAAVEFVAEALENAGPNDLSGVVVFGGEAMVERTPAVDQRFPEIESQPSPHRSDLAGGLRLATALLPSDRTRRVVLLSDGKQTAGDAAATAMLAAAPDLVLEVVSIGGSEGSDPMLEDLIAPERVDEGAAFEVKAVLRSNTAATGTLRLYRNDTELGSMPVDLSGEAPKILRFRQHAAEPGLARFRAVFLPDGEDAHPENNKVVTTVRVSGKPRILLVARDKTETVHLSAALAGEGLEVETIAVERMPAGLPELRAYSAVVLFDVPSFQMTELQQASLRAYVRDLGRGFAMIGGDHSFGVGGWYGTPVEETLPVRMDLEDKTRFPKLGMVLAIDKSCSMGGGAGSKLEMAQEAAIRTADLLNDRDSLGLIGFDGAASWISPLEPLSDRQKKFDDIAGLRPGGGTDIYPAISAALAALRQSDSALKHVIVLSDGMTSSGDFETLIRGGLQDNITLSAVTFGTDADRSTMSDFAAWGGGEYYLVTDKHSLPAVFTREAMLATRAFLVEEPFVPKRGGPSPLSQGVGSIPMLDGYVATEPKPRSTVPWVVDVSEGKTAPLLAHWQFGLGRSLAFTSDGATRWSRRWIGTEGYTRTWGQAGRWLVGDPSSANLGLGAEIVDGTLVVTADAFDPTGGFRNFLKGEARVVAPDLTVIPVPLQQTGPGRYQAELPVTVDGSWLAGVQLLDGEDVVAQGLVEAVQPYSPEYALHPGGMALLEEVARLGGGSVLTDPAEVFRRPEVPRELPRPLWPWLLGLAAFVLLADVANRRLGRITHVGTDLLPAGKPMVAKRRSPFAAPVAPAAAGGEGEAKGEAAPVETPIAERPIDESSYAGRLLKAKDKSRKRRRK